MPYKRRQPVPVEEMDVTRWHGHHTICQTLRDMYHETQDENIRLKLRLCMAFAKAMNDKLQWYKHRDEEMSGKLPVGTVPLNPPEADDVTE